MKGELFMCSILFPAFRGKEAICQLLYIPVKLVGVRRKKDIICMLQTFLI